MGALEIGKHQCCPELLRVLILFFPDRPLNSMAAMTSVYMQQSPQSATFSNTGEQRSGDNQDGWSGDESLHDGESPDKKRKRPMSVSCELCKQRKVKCSSQLHSPRTQSRLSNSLLT